MPCRLRTCVLILSIVQLCTSASISTKATEPEIQEQLKHVRQAFLDFPCSNKVVVNQFFDSWHAAYNPIEPDYEGDINNDDPLKVLMPQNDVLRLVVVGNNSNVSPDDWPYDVFITSQLFWIIPGLTSESFEEYAMKMSTELHLTSAQSDRLKIFFLPTTTPNLELKQEMYLQNFPIGLALRIPDKEIEKILNEHIVKNSNIDVDLKAAILDCRVELLVVAEKKCGRDLIMDKDSFHA